MEGDYDYCCPLKLRKKIKTHHPTLILRLGEPFMFFLSFCEQ